MLNRSIKHWLKKILSGGGTIVYFLMAFEVMIMISPFAFFFYSAFNPVFHFLGRYSATRWLTQFFLPHMVFPPSTFLQGLRIGGSVLFVLGISIFFVCAFQVYLGKILKHGVATIGLYQVIRHPQYLGLAVCGIGMAILWPRFLVLVSLSFMMILYYFLAKDEERRMTNEHGDVYRKYLARTGMFLPRWVEQPAAWIMAKHSLKSYQKVIIPMITFLILMASGFLLRTLTVAELPVQIKGNLAVISMLPEDNELLNGVVGELRSLEGRLSNNLFLSRDEVYLGYLMPVDYVMQGMIANTAERWKLYKHHHTLHMITDWVFHPFRHLRRPPLHTMQNMPAGHSTSMARRHLCPLGINDRTMNCSDCPYRRIVIVRVENYKGKPVSKAQVFSLNAERTAVAYLDLDVRSGKIIDVSEVQGKTAWEKVPTPAF